MWFITRFQFVAKITGGILLLICTPFLGFILTHSHFCIEQKIKILEGQKNVEFLRFPNP